MYAAPAAQKEGTMSQIPATYRAGRAVKRRPALGAATKHSLRWMLFTLMYWLRGPIALVLKVIAGGAIIIGCAMVLSAFVVKSDVKLNAAIMAVVYFAISYGAFMAIFYYDSWLLRLAPENVEVILTY
jgi:hypothetical protein